MLKNCLVAAVFILASTNSYAERVSLAPQEISSIRGEGSVVLLAFSTGFPAGSGCSRRVWIPLSDEAGRAKFSLAMLAFASGKTVNIRAINDEASKVYGECKIHDIVVSN